MTRSRDTLVCHRFKCVPGRACRRRSLRLGATGLTLLILLQAGAGGRTVAVAQRNTAPQDTERSVQRPGYLGVSLRDLDAAEATRLNVRGVMIVTVDRDGPAWTAGLRPQDVVVEMNGLPVDGVEALRRRLRECPSGDSITLRILRGSEQTSFAVSLGDQDTVAQNALTLHLRPSAAFAGPVEGPPVSTLLSPPPPARTRGMASTLFDALMPSTTYTGLEVNPLTPQLAAFFGVHAGGGLLVTDVRLGSPAATAGLAAGDVIVRAGRDPVATRSRLAHTFRDAKGAPVTLAVLRDHKEFTLRLVPGRRKRL